MREAKELFYDKNFLNKLDDSNTLSICFNNYVIDFKNKIHRKVNRMIIFPNVQILIIYRLE